MKVPLSITNLQPQLNSFRLFKNWLVDSWKTKLNFENKFSNYIGVKYSVSMNSCTGALECAVKLLKKGEV